MPSCAVPSTGLRSAAGTMSSIDTGARNSLTEGGAQLSALGGC
jgi:hypothetical protein